MVVYDTKLFRVLWIRPDKTIQILDTVPKNFGSGEFELSCKPAKEAEQFQKMANASEGIHVFLKLPKGNGMLCYFTSDTDSKCWTGGGKDGALFSAGGWQT